MAGGHRDIDRTDEVVRDIEDGLGEYVEAVYEATLKQILKNMASGKDAMGRSWTPLQPETVAAKGSSTPLVDEGDLMDSIERDSYVDTKVPVAVFSSKLAYAGTHEFGFPEQNIPPRPFLQPGVEYAASITEEVWQAEVDAAVQADLL